MFFQTLRSRIFLSLIGGIIFTTITLMYFVHRETTSAIFKAEKENAENLVDSLLLDIGNAYHSILFHKQSLLKQRQKGLKDNVALATITVEGYYLKFRQGKLSEQEAKNQAVNAIRRLRYDDGRGYFWISNTNSPLPLVIMHAMRPGLEGTRPDDQEFNNVEKTNENLLVAMGRIALKKGQGFVQYRTPKPDDVDSKTSYAKISFINYFKPWDWVIGTGAYISDIEDAAQERLAAVIDELNTSVPKMRIAETGYMFIFNGKRDNLVHPLLKGQNSADLLNPVTGKPMTDELMQAAHSQSKIFNYLWDRPDNKGQFIYPKIAIMRYFAPLDWYIGSTIYYDEIGKPAIELNKKLLLVATVLLLLALVFAFFIARTITRPLKKLSSAVRVIEKNGISSAKIPLGGTIETKQLGGLLSSMISSVQMSEQALRQSEERFSILYNTADPTLLIENGRITDCNQATLDMLKLNSLLQILGSSPAKHAPECQPDGEISEKKFNAMASFALKQDNCFFEWMYSRPSGETFWAEILLTPVLFQERQHLHCVWRDITARKQAIEDLRQNEENMRATLDSIGDAVISIDQGDRILRMNPVAEKLTGWSIAEAYKLPLPEILTLVDANTNTPLAGTIATDLKTPAVNFFGSNVKLISRNGTMHRIAATAAPIRDMQGHSEGVVLVFRDETEKIRIEKQLVQAQKMEAIATLAGGLAHDFNNVLSGILGPVSLLEQKLLGNKKLEPKKLSSFVAMIRHSSERAAEIVRQLLTISQKHELSAVVIDVKRSLHHVLTIAENTFDKSIVLTPMYSDSTPANIQADPTQIEQVLLNLMINAAHAMTIMREPEEQWGGELKIDVIKIKADTNFADLHADALAQHYWMISISDTGIGMDASSLSHMFTPFFTTKDKGVGTGLGLTMVYNIVQQHGGFITPYSEVDRGTTFNIYLPLHDTSDNIQKEIEPLDRQLKGEGTILIVEDEPILRKISTTMLIECGYKVITAKDGREAVIIFDRQHETIDAVLLDMAMPSLSGAETFRQMQQIKPDITVLLTSGSKNDNRVQTLLDGGVAGFIQKPFDINALASALQQCMNR